MDFREMAMDQIKEVMSLSTREETLEYFDKEGITLPEKVPYEWPAETEKFIRQIWKKAMFPIHETCAEEDHDFQPSGRTEMERNAATEPGSCFRKEFRCTKCGVTKWVSDKEPEPVEESAAAAEDDPAAARAARRAARKAAREAAAN